MNQIEITDVDIVFGSNPNVALRMLDEGMSRDKIRETTSQVVAVKGISLSVSKGEVLVLMGLSGSGKSSLLRAMNGLNRAARGKILVNGIDVGACSGKVLRQLRLNVISMVFQRFSLLPWKTVEQNVGFGLEIKGVSPKERKEKVEKSLDLVGLGKWKKYFPSQLSGGMQQRVGLARALSTGAEILLMDEPFSALDPLIRAELQNELLRLQDELRKTIVFVSHDLQEASKIGNRIAIMQAGEVVQLGTPQEVVSNPANDYVRRFVAGT